VTTTGVALYRRPNVETPTVTDKHEKRDLPTDRLTMRDDLTR